MKGLTHKKIAELTNYSVARIEQILNAPACKEYMRGLVATQERAMLLDPIDEVRAELSRRAMPAVQRIATLMDTSENERIQLNAANSLLDRTVPRKIQQAPAQAQFVLPDKIADRLLKALEETKAIEQAIDITEQSLDPDPSDEDPR